jgi:hypothetical protein
MPIRNFGRYESIAINHTVARGLPRSFSGPAER